MDILTQYMERAAEIIGDRTAGEERYDREVVRWLERGRSIRKAIAKANQKYPNEALKVDDATLEDVQARYEYLMNHERILRQMQKVDS